MNMNRVKRNALNQELKFYHSSSVEYREIQYQIELLDRLHHTRRKDPRYLSRDEKLEILSFPPSQR